MPATISLTASVKDVNAALSWVREVRPDKITLSLDAQAGTAELRCLSQINRNLRRTPFTPRALN